MRTNSGFIELLMLGCILYFRNWGGTQHLIYSCQLWHKKEPFPILKQQKN